MAVCIQCKLDKRVDEFRSKTSGTRAGYVFPTCKQCEDETAQEALADVLRARGYTCTAPFVVKTPPDEVKP